MRYKVDNHQSTLINRWIYQIKHGSVSPWIGLLTFRPRGKPCLCMVCVVWVHHLSALVLLWWVIGSGMIADAFEAFWRVETVISCKGFTGFTIEVCLCLWGLVGDHPPPPLALPMSTIECVCVGPCSLWFASISCISQSHSAVVLDYYLSSYLSLP